MTQSEAQEDEPTFGAYYRKALRTSASINAAVYGFSVTVTCTVGILSSLQGSPSPGRLIAFAGGAIAAFTLIEGAVSAGFRHRFDDEPPDVKAMGSSFSFFSVGLSLAIVWGLGLVLGGLWIWPLAAFCSTCCYLIAFAGEMGIAQYIQVRRGMSE